VKSGSTFIFFNSKNSKESYACKIDQFLALEHEDKINIIVINLDDEKPTTVFKRYVYHDFVNEKETAKKVIKAINEEDYSGFKNNIFFEILSRSYDEEKGYFDVKIKFLIDIEDPVTMSLTNSGKHLKHILSDSSVSFVSKGKIESELYARKIDNFENSASSFGKNLIAYTNTHEDPIEKDSIRTVRFFGPDFTKNNMFLIYDPRLNGKKNDIANFLGVFLKNDDDIYDIYHFS